MVRRYAPLFDTLEQHPLTVRQREACVLDEAANLVLAGAGSGKTSVLAGRVAYLLASGLAQPQEILLLAFGKQAADEMRERIASRLPETQEASAPSPEISTFHALGLAIIQAVEGKRPALSPLAEGSGARLSLVQDAFEVALQDPNYRSRVLEYLRRYLYPRTDPMQFTERAGYLGKLAAEELKSLKGETMYSLAEVQIGNWLFRQGIEYCYQHPWPLPLKHSSHQEVLPQFFLPEPGIWIRHLTLDRRGKALPWQDATAYQAAAVALSQTGGAPVIIDTYYWQWQSNRLEKVLPKELEQRQIPWQPLPEEAVLATLREWGRLQELVEQLNEMLGYYKAGCFDSARLKQQLAQSTEPARAKAALVLLRPLFERYQQELKRTRSMDFDDMIGLAIEHVANGRFISPWRQILVDEFQDISEPRARLLRLLRDQHPESALFCVGDDWQAIYRFTGADLSLTTKFADYFGPAAVTALDKTFRFNNAIGEVANRFVQANPAQLRKPLASLQQVEGARVTLHWLDKNAGRSAEPVPMLETLLSQMARSVTTPPTSVLLLARFRFSLPDAAQLQRWQQQFPQLSIEAMTLHGAKGREADQVILCGLESGRHGLPSEKETHPLIAALLPKAEVFAHAEERRLLYVGLTRARQQVFLLADRARPSPFVQELLTEGYRLDVVGA
jgi:DNA helicase-4